jgi:hypothetical protein
MINLSDLTYAILHVSDEEIIEFAVADPKHLIMTNRHIPKARVVRSGQDPGINGHVNLYILSDIDYANEEYAQELVAGFSLIRLDVKSMRRKIREGAKLIINQKRS